MFPDLRNNLKSGGLSLYECSMGYSILKRSFASRILTTPSGTGCVLTTSEEWIRLLEPANVMWSNKAGWPVAKDRSAVVYVEMVYIPVMDMKNGITVFMPSAEVKWGPSSGPEGREF
jgi:hypothetical protein